MEQLQQKPKTSPKDFFLNIGAIFVLYFLVVNAIALLFQTIDTAFPRTLAEQYLGVPDISFPLAALIVGFPFFLILSKVLLSGEREEPEKRELSVRKWLTFLTLFVAGATMVIDLIVLLSTFLRGDEITIGFILKILAVLTVAGVVFGYYISDLRYKGLLPLKKYFAYGATLFVVLIISWGFSVFGSPATQKAMRLDGERVTNLQMIQNEVFNYWQVKKTVPVNITDLNDAVRGVALPKDPRTGESYGYEKISATSFKLCATFERVGGKNDTERGVTPVSVYTPFEDYWGHEAGKTCFERTIDPTRYPDIMMKGL